MHHHRRKSGNTSMTDVRKAVAATDPSTKHRRPAMARRHTPVSAQKLGRGHRERERDWQESWDDERESFPQFCMTCEKQFVPHEEKFLYCSDTCRRVDQSSSTSSHHAAPTHLRSYASSSNYPSYALGNEEPRDIIPRASPSRPTSVHFSSSPPVSPGMTTAASTYHQHHTSAISALRSLNIGPPSPPSPTGSGGGGIWPFGRSVATSPGNSYTRPSAPYLSSTYDGGYYAGAGAYTYDVGPDGPDRPLPSRHPSAYSRPKSIELVTPVVGR
ncbi:Uncharacterized protein TCAP_02161 [Tolypocladium capitatum]|uniref:Life-span regulatory factor domain-containing protein n=1 Tax=Tolypocladium capitatum TaxID=45235 RepID=A0A2K3QK73_9HYPO|nr:Uncharacterized protein TCAP_02161 [Tolypocladium capitatum]